MMGRAAVQVSGRRRVTGFAAGVALLVASTAPLAQAQSVRVNRISVEGNQRVEDATIRVFSGLEQGSIADSADLNAALQRLFDTGLFEDVSVTPSGGGVVIEVVENPTINFINFEGNRKLDDDMIGSVVSLQARQPFSRAAAEADAQAIQQLYAQSGRINATVVPKIIRLDDNRVNLVYEIRE
ncbi:MAG: outer membrane protein assembly factor BamA, partial [Rhodobacteraceae bacterium]|nr:outer membrane protein assembly factor BamA [Paracoccaceae bacterium]